METKIDIQEILVMIQPAVAAMNASINPNTHDLWVNLLNGQDDKGEFTVKLVFEHTNKKEVG